MALFAIQNWPPAIESNVGYQQVIPDTGTPIMNMYRSIILSTLFALSLCAPLSAQPSWTVFGDLRQARTNFQAVAIGNGQALVMGGYAGPPIGGLPTAGCELIDVVQRTITPVAPMHSPRAAFAALLTSDSNVVVIGGDRTLDENSGELTPTVELYDRTAKTWKVLGSLLVERYQHVATFINDREILVVGGRWVNLRTLADAEIFDITTGTSRAVASFPFPINHAVMGRASNGDIVVTAGRNGGLNGYRERNVYRYDVAGDRWSVVSTLARELNAPILLKLWDGRLSISGGSHSEQPTPNLLPHDLSSDVQIENAGQWSTLARMQITRHWSGMAQWTADTILTIGGFDEQAVPLRSTDWINVATGESTPGPAMIRSRHKFAAIDIPTGFDCNGVPRIAAVLAISGQSDAGQAITTVEILEGPACRGTLRFEEDRTICQGGSAQLQAPCGSSFRWTPSDGLSCTDCADPIASPTTTTTYTVTDGSGCPTSTSFRVIVTPLPDVTLPADLSLCEGDSVRLAAIVGSGTPPYTYSWSPSTGLDRSDIANPVASPTATTIYRLRVTDANACTSLSGPLTVTVHPAPLAPTITVVDDTLTASPAYGYRWIRGDGRVIEGWRVQRIIVPPGRYAVETIDANGCRAISEFVRVGARRTVRLDTIQGRVGEPLFLTMYVDPSIEAHENIGAFEGAMRVVPSSLAAMDVVSPDRTNGNDPAVYDRTAGGSISIERPAGSAAISGAILFRMEVLGLTTAQPVNVVRIDSILLDGEKLVVAGHGLVLLEGCDIANPVGFDRPVSIIRVTPNPLSGNARVRYRAPLGNPVDMHLIDMTGATVLTSRLPDGTGEEQEESLSLDDLASGLYRLELRDRSERSAMTILLIH